MSMVTSSPKDADSLGKLEFVSLLDAVEEEVNEVAAHSVAELADRIDAGQLIGYDQFGRLKKATSEQIEGARARLARHVSMGEWDHGYDWYLHELDLLRSPPQDIWVVCGFNKADLEVEALSVDHVSAKAEGVSNARASSSATQGNESVSNSRGWKSLAREVAQGFVAAQAAKDLYPSQDTISDHVANALRAQKVFGEANKPLAPAYIKRHALKGISSGSAKARSAANLQRK
jgi:hypothetical protein